MTKPIHSLALATAIAFAGNVALAEVTLTWLTTDNADDLKVAETIAAAFTAAHPDITIEIETRPGGADGDNIIKTRLATGEMTDVFSYNSGSLFQAINPTVNLVDLSDIGAQANILDSFKSVVTADGKVYGVPLGTAMGGGILYNIPVYEQLGLSVPKTWADFMANNAAIKAAGIAPVAQTYGSTWTSQLFVLADFYNVQAANPSFAADYTNNVAKYATTPVAVRGFEHLQEVFEAGYLNEDFGAATYDNGIEMIANGTVAHYPMLTFAASNLGQLFPEKLADVGFFAQPGDSADVNGMTTWMPAAVYIPQTTEHVEEAKMFLDFVASVEGCDLQTQAVGATGPYLVSGCTLPDDVTRIVADMLPYFQTEGATAPALEFLSPIKGPSLEQITVEVGSGIRPAADAAALYDQDVEKQAKQLGLPNW